MNSLNKDTNDDFISSLLTGNRIKCSQIIKNAIEHNYSVIRLYDEIIKHSLYQIGELWENNKISVASEHLATSITESLLNELYYDIISEKRLNKRVIVACVENEHHQIGIKMVADIFEKNGWDAFFLGANIPLKELIVFIRSAMPDIIALSLSIYFHIPELEETIIELQHEFPDIPIIVGGQAFRHGGIEIISKYSNVTYLDNLEKLELFINKMNNNG